MFCSLLENDGLAPKRKTAGEYASACPACGGDDRFCIFIDKNRGWCRQCGWSGDAIQYLRDFHGMSFQEAAAAVGKEAAPKQGTLALQHKRPTTKPAKKEQPALWRKRAADLIGYAAGELQKNRPALQWLQNDRGISPETAARFSLGWIEQNIYDDKKMWGVEPDGKKMFIPSGLVIPWKDKRVRIRRDDPGDYGRYFVLQGSDSQPYTIGSHYENTAIVLESELDAILLSQEISRDVFIIALGSSTVKPDEVLLKKLFFCPIILVCLDTDEAGAKAAKWWLDNVSGTFCTLTPSSYGKDATEAFLNGLDLNEWLSASMELYCDDNQFTEGNQ